MDVLKRARRLAKRRGMDGDSDMIANDDQALSRRTDPATSDAAAQSVTPELPRLENVVLDALKRRGDRGATTNELATLTGMSLVTISPRIRPLVRKNLVEDSGDRRAGASGRKSTVWRAVGKPKPQIIKQDRLL